MPTNQPSKQPSLSAEPSLSSVPSNPPSLTAGPSNEPSHDHDCGKGVDDNGYDGPTHGGSHGADDIGPDDHGVHLGASAPSPSAGTLCEPSHGNDDDKGVDDNGYDGPNHGRKLRHGDSDDGDDHGTEDHGGDHGPDDRGPDDHGGDHGADDRDADDP